MRIMSLLSGVAVTYSLEYLRYMYRGGASRWGGRSARNPMWPHNLKQNRRRPHQGDRECERRMRQGKA